MSRNALGEQGNHMAIEPWIRVGKSMSASTSLGHKVVGSAVEALYGALHREVGFAACHAMAARWMGPHIARMQRAATTATTDKAFQDGKSKLQEYTQARWKEVPVYRVIGREGPDHAVRWLVEVEVRGEVLAEGMASKKDDAMKKAAALALMQLRQREAAPNTPSASHEPPRHRARSAGMLSRGHPVPVVSSRAAR